jgi:AAA domain
MAIKIQTIDESIQDNGLKLLVYGALGTGKTRLAATAASQDSPVLIINAEAGMLSLRNIDEASKKHISVVTCKTFGDIDDVYDQLTTEYNYKWICIDSISEVAEVVLASEKSSQKDPRAAYGNLADIMMSMIRAYRDLNVYMSCKMTRFTDEITNRTSYWPMMPGKQLTNGIGYLFDEVFALRVELDAQQNPTRWLQTNRDIQYEAKDRSGKLDMFEPADLTNIENKINSTNEVPF